MKSPLSILRPSAVSRRVRTGLAALGLVLFSAPAAFGYRTIEDDADVPDGARVHWRYGRFEFFIHDDRRDSIDAAAIAEVTRKALSTWAVSPCALLTPVEQGTTTERAAPDDGRNTIEFVESDWASLGYPDEAAGATDVAIAERDDGTWEIVEADVYINAEHHLWSVEDELGSDERSLLGVLVHELGHALGLMHPCEVDGTAGAPVCDEAALPDAIMSPYYDSAQTVPTQDDYDGLCYLYDPCDVQSCGAGFVCVSGECEPEPDDGNGEGGSAGESGSGGESGGGNTGTRPTGDRCSESNQCEGGECVEGAEGGAVCTHACGGDKPKCPTSWTCEEVEFRRVCIPPEQDDGCSIARVAPHSPGAGLRSSLWPALLVGLAWLARRRRRPKVQQRVNEGRLPGRSSSGACISNSGSSSGVEQENVR